jgi:putative sporulation protein YtxC
MELFTITLANRPHHDHSKLESILQEELSEGIHNSIRMDPIERNSQYFVQIRGQLKVTEIQETMEWLRYRISSALAEYVLEVLEKQLVDTLVCDQKKHLELNENDKIHRYAFQLLDEGNFEEPSPEYRFQRKNRLFYHFYQYLSDHSSMNLDGFVQFRLSEYRQELKNVIEHAVDEFILDKEYQEFISLLRYFVGMQDPKMEIVHVNHTNNQFHLLDEFHQPIDPADLDWLDKSSEELVFEDMVVSTLINVSPEKIMLHTRDQEQTMINTLLQIFSDRIQLCSNCALCNPSSTPTHSPLPLPAKHH